MKHYFLLYVLWGISQVMWCQRVEYFVKVDQSTSNFYRIDSLENVDWILTNNTTYDHVNHRYFFVGADAQFNATLYTLDALTAKILYQTPFPVYPNSNDQIQGIEYDETSDLLYAVYWKSSDSLTYFVSFNYVNGACTFIDTIPNVVNLAWGYTTFDQTNRRYFFRAGEDVYHLRLYSINIATGQVLANPLEPVTNQMGNFGLIEYDKGTNKLYGLYRNDSTKTEYLVDVNPADFSFTSLYPIPGVISMAVSPNYKTFDWNNHRFIFLGRNSDQQLRLYTLNVLTGAVEWDPLFPQLNPTGENLIQFEFDNGNQNLYALNWGVPPLATCEIEKILIYPNPSTEMVTIKFDREFKEVKLSLIDPMGRVVKGWNVYSTSSVILNREDIRCGTYFLQIRADDLTCNSHKLVFK